MKKCKYCPKEMLPGDYHLECRLTFLENVLAAIQNGFKQGMVRGLSREVWRIMHTEKFKRGESETARQIRLLEPNPVQEMLITGQVTKENEKNILTDFFFTRHQ